MPGPMAAGGVVRQVVNRKEVVVRTRSGPALKREDGLLAPKSVAKFDVSTDALARIRPIA